MAAKTSVVTPRKKGQKAIHFSKGGLHRSLGVPQGQKISSSKMQGALAGRYGKKAASQARFAKNVLVGRSTKGSPAFTPGQMSAGFRGTPPLPRLDIQRRLNTMIGTSALPSIPTLRPMMTGMRSPGANPLARALRGSGTFTSSELKQGYRKI